MQAQVSYVSAPVTGAQAAGSGRPAARHAQGAARPAADGPGYSRTPMSPLEPRNSGFPDSRFPDSRFPATGFHDNRFQATGFHDIPFEGSGRAPEPTEAEPATAPADRPDQDGSEPGNSQWDTSPGPMGSRRPGRG